MEFRHLRYFLVLAEELHFGRAARRLSISQPPLSLNIQQLEASVGARLFERDSKGVRLTAAGRAFREAALALMAQAEDARLLARQIEAGAIGRLRVGFVGSMLYRGLPQKLQEFAQLQPGIEVALTELNSQEQIDALLHDRLDVGFIHTGRVPDELAARLVHREPFVCCMPQGHPLAAQATVPLSDLREQPFVLFSRHASPDYHARIVDMCAAEGFFPQIRHEVRHWLSVVSLVSQGMGVAVVPAALQRSALAGAEFRPLIYTGVTSDVYCVWKAGPDHPARNRFTAIFPERVPAEPDEPPDGDRR
ncbi:LysR substrate-binding domain-containing protein [Cupriavidus sp. AU9028]|uniref:LysR substrate-binding domain-containing protein n=1 Tax=Cupriavidus sp. AU9028 TaxID=2871157 RepID=UPI001C95D6A5|nr:LysR substrate-binding domain-containing protein [Cupriavidus sp. AU9028]MBY4896928.1 LysR family transcriptional regulator [Cupriavidus sp. AU9028]